MVDINHYPRSVFDNNSLLVDLNDGHVTNLYNDIKAKLEANVTLEE
jgi:hypothetical protein